MDGVAQCDTPTTFDIIIQFLTGILAIFFAIFVGSMAGDQVSASTNLCSRPRAQRNRGCSVGRADDGHDGYRDDAGVDDT